MPKINCKIANFEGQVLVAIPKNAQKEKHSKSACVGCKGRLQEPVGLKRELGPFGVCLYVVEEGLVAILLFWLTHPKGSVLKAQVVIDQVLGFVAKLLACKVNGHSVHKVVAVDTTTRKRDLIDVATKQILHDKCSDCTLTTGDVVLAPMVAKPAGAGFNRPAICEDVIEVVQVVNTFVEMIFDGKIVLPSVVIVGFFHSRQMGCCPRCFPCYPLKTPLIFEGFLKGFAVVKKGVC